jgi:hypothetical protein
VVPLTDSSARLVPNRSSSLAQGNINFLDTPRGIGQRLGDVFRLQIRILAKNLLVRSTCGHEADDGPDGQTHAADTGSPAHDADVPGDAS